MDSKKLNTYIVYELLKSIDDAPMNQLIFENGIPDDLAFYDMTQMGFITMTREQGARIIIEMTDQGFHFYRRWNWKVCLPR